jgi:hypothetical protein
MKQFITLIYLVVLCSCDWQGFVIEKNITENLYLVAVDINESVTIALPNENNYVAITSPTVIAYGFNQYYLYFKQISDPKTLQYSNDFGSAKYYILVLNDNLDAFNYERFLLGPYNKYMFMQFCANLAIDTSNVFKYKYGKDY